MRGKQRRGAGGIAVPSPGADMKLRLGMLHGPIEGIKPTQAMFWDKNEWFNDSMSLLPDAGAFQVA